MKRQLALRLLRGAISESLLDEDRFREIMEDLAVLARLKYDRYEMFQPGRLFFESLYAWLRRFTSEEERLCALEFVHRDLIFISRDEFEQLTQVVYHDRIRQKHFDGVSERTGISRFRVRELANHELMKWVERGSLYIGMSDGARIDFLRRQNLGISNEQVLPSYDPSSTKTKDILRELRKESQIDDAKFECMFLIDDFVGSGRTLLRETISHSFDDEREINIPQDLKSMVKWDIEERKLSLNYRENGLDPPLEAKLRDWAKGNVIDGEVESMIERYLSGTTELTGSLIRFSKADVFRTLADAGRVFLCPLLITEGALSRLKRLIVDLADERLSRIEILPGGVISDDFRLEQGDGGMAEICEKYYRDDLGDDHTGPVMFGYEACGLPVVLHHNTPNNSIYPLWSRDWESPLFVRHERHGRKARMHA